MTSATYDGNGLRQSQTIGGTTQNFTWGDESQLLLDSTNAYLYDGGTAPFEQVNLSTGAITYLATDSLGSVRGVVNSNGSLVASTSYDPWGNPRTAGGLSSYTPFGYAGGYTDQDGLVYLVNRYYDPSTGEFLSVDPAVDQTGQPYQYAGDDPVNSADPLGLWQIGLASSDPPTANELPFEIWLGLILGFWAGYAQYQYKIQFNVPYKSYPDILFGGWLNEAKVGHQTDSGPNKSEANRDRELVGANDINYGGTRAACHPGASGDPHCYKFGAKGAVWWFRYKSGDACQMPPVVQSNSWLCPNADLRRNLLDGHPHLNIVYIFYDADVDLAPVYHKNRAKLRRNLENEACPNDALDKINIPNLKFTTSASSTKCSNGV
jgi:RHS repeat-associated protein